ncbi:MAG: hypothetical protein E7590_06140 [Ruminococcaceae bacterium]|nr:hypothetical protein [Oscillospiraceae bacterium]MBE6703499.1 hypothetical protein [Oscillospiraceae bacterium]
MKKRVLCMLLATILLMLVGCKPSDPSEEPESVTLPPSHLPQFDAGEGIYNYCPTVMQTDENTAYIYYCTNRAERAVVDHIGCRKGTRSENGTWSWGAERIVLSPTAGKWDAHHTCDPSVVAGKFCYEGETYTYLMAYLGCTSCDNQDNKIGIAVAKSPEGPFIKVGDAPLVDFEFEGSADVWEWGVGQPSLVSLDKKGSVMLFYTRGDRNGTRTVVEQWALSDLSAPVRSSSETLPATGLENLEGQQDFINNADFVYDAAGERFFAVSDCHPNPTEEPDYISSHFRITCFDYSADLRSISWQNVCTVGESESGFARNHNAGLLRDAYGHLPDPYLTAFYTVSVTGPQSLWSYRIYSYHTLLP